MTRRTIIRPRNIALGDTRSPMVRLLEDCNNPKSGMIEIAYAQQWPTLFKAMRLGYADNQRRLTDKGRNYLAARR